MSRYRKHVFPVPTDLATSNVHRREYGDANAVKSTAPPDCG
jgi:hypothetical protein